MLEVIPSIIAAKHGLKLGGTPTIYREGRSIKAVWTAGESAFTFYSNGNWDIVQEDGTLIEGHTTPPTQKRWVTRLERLYCPEYAVAAWFEWVCLKRKKRR